MGIQKSLKREKRENNHNIYMKKQNGAGKYTDLIMKAIDEKPISSLPDIKKWITRNCDYNTSSCKNWKKINKALREMTASHKLEKRKGKWREPSNYQVVIGADGRKALRRSTRRRRAF